MSPFDRYPKDEEELCRALQGSDNCRHGYGLDLQRRTGQTRCAYCGISLVDDYHHWLLLCVDHVVPLQEGRRVGIPDRFLGGLVNYVLCCSGCNGFRNRYHVPDEDRRDAWELDDFVRLRDKVFAARREQIAERRRTEMAFFDGRPWER